jgi:hypothetical protein
VVFARGYLAVRADSPFPADHWVEVHDGPADDRADRMLYYLRQITNAN